MSFEYMNKKIIIILAVLVAAGIGGYFFYQNSIQPPKTKFVTFKGDPVIKMGTDSYEPQNFRIKKGTKVTFDNTSGGLRWPASDFHPSHLLYPEFDPKEPIGKDAKWTFQFDKVGEWGYHDHLAPYITGRIQVTE